MNCYIPPFKFFILTTCQYVKCKDTIHSLEVQLEQFQLKYHRRTCKKNIIKNSPEYHIRLASLWKTMSWACFIIQNHTQHALVSVEDEIEHPRCNAEGQKVQDLVIQRQSAWKVCEPQECE